MNRGALRWIVVVVGLGLVAGGVALGYRWWSEPWREATRRYNALGGPTAAAEIVEHQTPVGGLDRCATCHRSALPGARSGDAHPLKSHPTIKGHPDVSSFGCTPCHGGRGDRLDLSAHGPTDAHANAFMNGALVQARCARCHLPTDLPGAPTLSRGISEFLVAGCTGCHQPGRREVGVGVDLRAIGPRTPASLRATILQPRRAHATKTMWSVAWRYDVATEKGRAGVDGLVTALVAFADDRKSYAASHAKKRGAGFTTTCRACHLAATANAKGAKHRCSYLTKATQLTCARCHPTAPPDGKGRCPQVAAALPTCAVCHATP